MSGTENNAMHEPTAGIASHLEEVARRFTSIGTSSSGGKYIGLDLTVEDFIGYLFTAMFRKSTGTLRGNGKAHMGTDACL